MSAIFQPTVGGSVDLTTEVSGVLPLANGGTAAATAILARENLWIKTGFKAADTSRASTTTATADTDLQFAVAANEVWEFQFWMHVNVATATPDLKLGLAVPTAVTAIRYTGRAYTNVDLLLFETGSATPTGGLDLNFGGATDCRYFIEGTLRNGANAGVVSINWAQLTSDLSPTTMKNGSRFIAHRLA